MQEVANLTSDPFTTGVTHAGFQRYFYSFGHIG
jgi:hypothetical protein